MQLVHNITCFNGPSDVLKNVQMDITIVDNTN